VVKASLTSAPTQGEQGSNYVIEAASNLQADNSSILTSTPSTHLSYTSTTQDDGEQPAATYGDTTAHIVSISKQVHTIVLIPNRASDATFARVVVGQQGKCFTVHQDLLVHHSPFFRAALTGSFKEADSKTVILADSDPQVFEFFVHWLYYQRFCRPGDSPELLALWTDDDDEDLKSSNLIMLYVFCDKYHVSALQRQTLDELFDHVFEEELPSIQNVGFAFENLREDDPLCRFFVDAYCYWSGAWMLDSVQALPIVFVTMVMQQYSRYAHGERDRTCSPELCDYHGHKEIRERLQCEMKRTAEV
jgi:hypothetical protein